MNNRRKECAVLVCSCDAYSDLWDPFFKLLHDQWSDKPEEWRIILNTETKKYINQYYNIETMGLEHKGRKLTWSNRMLKTLKKIDTEYVLVILDDYFQEKKIVQSRIDEVIKWMNEDSDIAVFYFSNIQDMDKFHIRDNRYEYFELNKSGCPYCVCAQTGIWRRKYLMKYLCKYEDIWQFEELASERAGYYGYKIYSAIKDSDYIFRHKWEMGGALRGGKWSQYVPVLLKEHGINIDYSKRGFFSEEVDGNPSVPKSIGKIKRLFRPPFLRRLLKNIKGK